MVNWIIIFNIIWGGYCYLNIIGEDIMATLRKILDKNKGKGGEEGGRGSQNQPSNMDEQPFQYPSANKPQSQSQAQ